MLCYPWHLARFGNWDEARRLGLDVGKSSSRGDGLGAVMRAASPVATP